MRPFTASGGVKFFKFKVTGDGGGYFGGNVGIGTTGPGLFGDTRVLTISGGTSGEVQGTLELQGARAADEGRPATIVVYNAANPIARFDFQKDNAVNSGQIRFLTYAAGVANERLTVRSSGNVGIGTTNPNYLLQVASGTDGRSVNLSNVLYVNGSLGNVGIGTTNPEEVLTVTGNVSISGTNCKDSASAPCTNFVDIAELFPASEPVESGDVVVIDFNVPTPEPILPNHPHKPPNHE